MNKITGIKNNELVNTVKEHLKKKFSIAESDLIEAVNEFVFADLDDNTDSVVTAAIQNKYNLETLKNIGVLGMQQWLEKRNARK